jgi:hypothetical protein
VSDLAGIYGQLARPWTADELAGAYHAAVRRGQSDLLAGQATARALPLLATAVPRLISLAVAAQTLHLLPASESPERVALDDELLATIAIAAAGSLCRCQFALDADALARSYSPEDSLPLVYDLAGDALQRVSLADEPPSIVDHSQQAGRWVAIAIEALDRDASAASEAIIDSLGHLLVVCVFTALAQCSRARGD